MFLDFLLKAIKEHQVDVLLVSGDVFDVANPAQRDRAVYYQALASLSKLDVTVIITGGNHDSVGTIDAPHEILSSLDVHVVGGAREAIEDELVAISDSDGVCQLVVAAVPYLRDRDLRTLADDGGGAPVSRYEIVLDGIKRHYERAAEAASSRYPQAKKIAMGHLYAKGSITSDSEREIQIGNEAPIDGAIFKHTWDYVALGHIHRPQIVGGSERVRYSGSPISLSFSEYQDEKSMVIYDSISDTVDKIMIPKARALVRVSGSLPEVTAALMTYEDAYPLPAFVEIEVHHETYSSAILKQVDDLVSSYQDHPQCYILKSKVLFADQRITTQDLYHLTDKIEDLSPKDVFSKLLDAEVEDEGQRTDMMFLFDQLLEWAEPKIGSQ